MFRSLNQRLYFRGKILLPRAQRLTTREFGRVFEGGKVLRHPLLSVRILPRDDGLEIVRAAFAVPKKIGGAVVRNRLRRRLRERYRLMIVEYERLGGCDLIFMASPAAVLASIQDLDEALHQLLRRAGKQSTQM